MPISHAKSNIVGDWNGTVTVANSSGGTTTMAGSDLVRPSDWNSAHVVNLSASELTGVLNAGSGVSLSTNAAGITVGLPVAQIYEPFPLHNTNSTLSAPGIGTWYIDGPYQWRKPYDNGQFLNLVSNAAGFLNGAVLSAAVTGSVTRYQTFVNAFALYKMDSGVNTSRLTLHASSAMSILATWDFKVGATTTSELTVSNALTISYPSQFDISGNVTYATTAQSGTLSVGASTMVSTSANTLITGAVAYVSGGRMDIVPFATSIGPDEYWVGHMFTSSSSSTGTNYSTGTQISTHSRLGLLENLVNAYKRVGSSASNSTTNVQPFHGYLATTTSAASALIAATDIRATTGRAYFMFVDSNY